MIEIETLASGSTGNCYIVSDGKTKIMIECGITIKKIREKWGFKIHEISGCLISHEH
jgi:phosphoribosyl 1,2-cyclic phosphodiesterase